MIKNKKGFTLIELLVVIAIIGILSSVVLASLNSARSKGEVAKTKAQLSQIRTQGELYYDDQTTGTYAGVCDELGFDATTPANSDLLFAGLSDPHCSDDDASYAADAITTGTDTWCIDSTGYTADGSVSTGTGP